MSKKFYPAKYRIIPEVVSFCLTSDLFRQMDTFLTTYEEINKQEQENIAKQLQSSSSSSSSSSAAASTASASPPSESPSSSSAATPSSSSSSSFIPTLASGAHAQYSLSSSAVHARFVQSFESALEAFLVSRKSSVQSFYELCRTAAEHEDPGVLGFIDIITRITEYETFMELVKDEQKRTYVKQILDAYAKMLIAEKESKK